MRRHNINAIINGIRSGNRSRADLSRELGLTRAAVTNLVDALVEHGLVTEMPSPRAAVGRTPNILKLVPDAVYFAGIWLTRGTSHACIADFEGRVVSSESFNKDPSLPWQARADKLIASLETQLAKTNIPRERVYAVGVGVPGCVDRKNGVILASPDFVEWRDVPITAYVKEKTGFDAFLEKDVGALAMAEKHLGAAKDTEDYMQLFVESGISVALVREGQYMRSVSGFEGEIGHTTVDINGVKCDCGRRGCLERYASFFVMLEKAGKKFGMGRPIDYNDLLQRLKDGDETAHAVLAEEASYLAAGITGAVRMTGVTDIIFSGDIARSSETLYPLIAAHFASDTLFPAHLTLRSSSLGKDAHLKAAANIAADRFFERFKG